jgi:hypothetical protein
MKICAPWLLGILMFKGSQELDVTVNLMNPETHAEIVRGHTLVHHVGELLRNPRENETTAQARSISYFCPAVKCGEILRFACHFGSIIRSKFCSGMSRIDFDTVCGDEFGVLNQLVVWNQRTHPH